MSNKKRYNIIPVVVIAVLLVIWQGACTFGLVPGYMLPSPVKVVKAFVSDFPLLMSHARVTILEAVLGLVIGVLLGFGCAALMDSFPVVKKGLYPILVLTQTIPPVAIAPLLILWFSYGIAPKVILVVLVAFFPMAVGLLEGFQSVDEDMIRLMKSMDASRWQIFWNVKFPAALGEFFSGLKIAVAYSIVGAVIAEWLGGFNGLGVYMTRVKKSLSYDKMFAVIFFVSAISLILMALVKYIQYKAMPWEHTEDK
ncbi:ABC-type nitrate/sulfonate/bicarbonate transport system, permease component [Lachnospiraceae bacterium NE2001]|nr:ABC-type nitrate/sulfonate/bicarbonate transport system, permease component [Lachnospiraceae bacterium NE2001]